MKYILVFFLCNLFLLPLFGQEFSITFDEVPISFEKGQGMIVEEDRIYITSGARCNDLSNDCVTVYCIDLDGDLIWKNNLENTDAINWENIIYSNDSLFIGGARFSGTNEDFLEQVILQASTGELLENFSSDFVNGLSLSAFGQIEYINNILMYGSGLNLSDNFDGPGYIHQMDKQGNYINHLEYRVDNFNAIYQLQEGPDDQMYFLCSSTSSTTDFDDYSLVKFDPDTYDTQEIVSIPFQSTTQVFPHYAMVSDGFVMSELLIDTFQGNVFPKFTLRWMTFDGELKHRYTRWPTDIEDTFIQPIYRMIPCANDDIVICGVRRTPGSIQNGYIMRFSPDGELLWERRYIAYDDAGRRLDNFLTYVAELPTGELVAIGGTQQLGELDSEEDLWVLKVGADGCLWDNDCDALNPNQFLTSTEEEIVIIDFESTLSLYPNPVSDRLTINSEDNTVIHTEIRNTAGVIVSSQRHNAATVSVDLSGYASGVYLAHVYFKDNVAIRRIVKY